MKQSKDVHGHYFIQYVLDTPPRGTDGTVWSVAVTEYLARNGVSQVTAQTTAAHIDWPEVRRLYNRLMGEGKQRRTADSTPAPRSPLRTTESED